MIEADKEASSMKIGPKMAFILRVYHMTEAENAEEIEHDREMVRIGRMSQSAFYKQCSTRSIARRIRHCDDLSDRPRDVNTKPHRPHIPFEKLN